MIANITKGADFGGLCRYLLHHSKSAEIIGGNVGGETPQALEAEFLAFANLNQRVRKPVNHMSLGFAPEDGKIDRTRQERIAARIVEEMGYGNAQYLVVAHGRKDPGHDAQHDHDHLHIVANSVDLNGKWVDDFQSFRRMEAILRKIERDEGLRQIESSWEVKRNAPTHGQTQRIKREVREVAAGERETVTLAVSDRLQVAIDKAATHSATVVEFARSLASDGISTQLKVTRTGKVQGISYGMEGVKFQGNQLFDASLPKLQSVRGLSFEPLTDPKIIAAIEINPNPPVLEITRHLPTLQPQINGAEEMDFKAIERKAERKSNPDRVKVEQLRGFPEAELKYSPEAELSDFSEPTVKEKIQAAIDWAAEQANTIGEEYIEYLEQQGIKTNLKLNANGNIADILYNMDGASFESKELIDANPQQLSDSRGLNFNLRKRIEKSTPLKKLPRIDIESGDPLLHLQKLMSNAQSSSMEEPPLRTTIDREDTALPLRATIDREDQTPEPIETVEIVPEPPPPPSKISLSEMADLPLTPTVGKIKKIDRGGRW
jgi:hypothetical protein